MAETKQDIWNQAIEALEGGAHSVLELHCRAYLEHEPENFPARMLLAHAQLKMKRFCAASEILEGADPIDERSLVLWHRTAGDYYSERGDYEAAQDEYASALALVDHQTSDLVLDLVDAMIAQGDNENAVEAIDTFVDRQAREVELEDLELLIHARARALRNLGRYDEAAKAVGDALERSSAGFPAAEALAQELEQLRSLG